MRLNKKQVQFIDNYLIKNKIKYVDVRLELIDHLASEFEEASNYALLDDFLNTKKGFINSFVKKRQKTIHWSYQKQLFKRVYMFFYKAKYLVATLIILAFIYFAFLQLSKKSLMYLFMASITIPNLASYIIHFKENRMFKKIQSAKQVLAIMSLPSLFIYCFGLIFEMISIESFYFLIYWFFAILFNIAGLIEVYERKTELIDKYRSLIKK
ncbi:hypothetical protein [Ichthyenterobacterium magnum]|uniref:Uncharacterized protein n=1 Tax=Ichthyenterobacterium magnum TaxID=1230530 RepID=A0A420DXB9_9FLAO|nr:hypothetical protein [Ichthyenterobacterium magnum]RKE98856.1 hypothetical protein BXY80_0951 [Ichthyenterobacterium magnum]